jgi:hypothetical protein
LTPKAAFENDSDGKVSAYTLDSIQCRFLNCFLE